MSLKHGLELHVGNDVSAHENKVRVDDLKIGQFL